MPTACIRFYGELNDFLPAARKQRTLECSVTGRVSVKDVIESLGVPHPEVDVLVVNGRTVSFAHLVEEGDRVAVYPRFTRLYVPASQRVGPDPQPRPRFVADAHMGRAAAYLRLLGFDTAYRSDFADHELAEVSAREDRVLLTRDVGALKHRTVRRGYFVRATTPAGQLVEVLRRFDASAAAAPFTRCLRCNAELTRISRDRVESRLPDRTRESFDEFSRCPACDRLYWKGSHYARMSRLVRVALALASSRGAYG